jgi:polysaccharide export outer membrane protein
MKKINGKMPLTHMAVATALVSLAVIMPAGRSFSAEPSVKKDAPQATVDARAEDKASKGREISNKELAKVDKEIKGIHDKKASISEAPEYVIGPEDVIEITVWKNPELSKVVAVRMDGRISLPLIGDMQAAGLSPRELNDSIVERLKAYQDTAIATVIVQDVMSYKVYIIGEVRTPGMYQLKTKTSVLQAIALAGGFTQYASKNKMVLVRRRPDGVDEKMNVSFGDLVSMEGRLDKNLILKPGDTLFVP